MNCGNKLFLIIFLLTSGAFEEARAQAFKKDKNYINLGLGIGGYNATTQIGEKVFEKRAGSLVSSINYEYGLLNQVGLGGQFQRGRYFSGDSTLIEKTTSNTYLFSNTLHFLNNDLMDLYLGISYGLSSYKFYSKNEAGNETLIKGLGFSYFVFSGIKVYFTKRTGFVLGINYNNLSYEIHTYKINQKNQFQNTRQNYNINYSGMNIQAGIAIALSK